MTTPASAPLPDPQRYIDAQAEEIKALRAERDATRDHVIYLVASLHQVTAEATVEIARLTEALDALRTEREG